MSTKKQQNTASKIALKKIRGEVKKLGYKELDYRKGNIETYKELINLYKEARNKGFVKEFFTEQDLQSYINSYSAKKINKNYDREFSYLTEEKDISIYVNKILRYNL